MINPVPIIFTIPNFITAGSGQALLNILQRLDKARFAPSVCVLKKGGDLDRVIEDMDLPLLEAPFAIPARPYTSLVQRAWQAAQSFPRGQYCLWHSFHYLDDYTEPIIARMAGAKAWVYTKKNMNWGSRAWYVRTLLATRVLAQNRDMRRELFSFAPFSRKTRLVPRGVVTTQFCPEIPTRLQVRQRLGIPAKNLMAGCVAHLVPVKGHPTLLRALARVPEIHLLMAGKPLDRGYAASLADLARTLNIQERVHFLGHIQDIPGFLAELDIHVLPTQGKGRMEGCPVALLEAMSSALACIASDVPGSRDVVEHGKSGLLFPPENVDALAAALWQLMDSPEQRLGYGNAARERVLRHFSIERETAAHAVIYEEILNSSCHSSPYFHD